MLLHEVTEQGWGNDSVGDLDEDGFHASLLIVEPAERQELTEAFDRDIPAGNWILTEDSRAWSPWTSIRRRTRPGAPSTTCPTPAVLGEDGTITPAGPLGSRYAVRLDLGCGPDGNRQTQTNQH
jgi:hypothetical protein